MQSFLPKRVMDGNVYFAVTRGYRSKRQPHKVATAVNQIDKEVSENMQPVGSKGKVACARADISPSRPPPQKKAVGKLSEANHN